MPKRVLILCTGNSIRSQMAEALWRELGEGEWETFSAGSHPSGYVHPRAVLAMGEIGIDISDQESKSAEEFVDDAFDLVVTVCDNAREHCPVFPGATRMEHWPFPDPTAMPSGADGMDGFRRVRDAIQERIETFLDDE